MAITFFNKAATLADTIAFIVPVQFRKFSVHRLLVPSFKWIAKYELPLSSFYTRNKADYTINTEFQIWTRLPNNDTDRRLFCLPATSHPDFDMWQYNNTPQAAKVFNNHFDFAVPRQGYEDYNRRETNHERCERTKQWILFLGRDKEIQDRLWNMDFDTLSRNNTIIPGFGKADVVGAYKALYAHL